MAKKRIVLIEWDDSATSDPWVKMGDAVTDPCTIHTVGILIERSKKHIVVAQSMTADHESVCATIRIPASVVRKVTRIGRLP